jgi:hypothetical protein
MRCPACGRQRPLDCFCLDAFLPPRTANEYPPVRAVHGLAILIETAKERANERREAADQPTG